jgi:hypothetical protein
MIFEAGRTSSAYPQQLLHPVLNLRLQCLIHRLLLSHFLGGGCDDSGGSWRNFHGGGVVSVGHDNDRLKCKARRRKEEERSIQKPQQIAMGFQSGARDAFAFDKDKQLQLQLKTQPKRSFISCPAALATFAWRLSAAAADCSSGTKLHEPPCTQQQNWNSVSKSELRWCVAV